MHLETDDARYAWLRQGLAVWVGSFDATTGQATWQVYTPTHADDADAAEAGRG